MARTIWSGSLSFGLVNVPVGLYPATQDKTIHFNQFEAGTSDRIRYKKVNERTGEEVSQSDIVKGFNVGDGDYVILSDDELTAADPERSRTIGISDFVDLDSIDPVYYRSAYYLAPQGEGARKAFALLRQVLADANKVAVATLVMRNKEYLVTIRPEAEVLVLQTMYFSDEVRDPAQEIPNLPVAEEFSEREVAMARMLIDSMAVEWSADHYHDSHRQRVEDLVEQKLRGDEIVTPAAPEKPKVVDLMAALQASVDAVAAAGKPPRSGRGGAAPTDGAAAKPAAKAKSPKAAPPEKRRRAS
ncbi:MAG TPA: Ku protein [Acidimicrobiales bacterium]|nr:Ku protein [Acidimicrobiales bacterium]